MIIEKEREGGRQTKWSPSIEQAIIVKHIVYCSKLFETSERESSLESHLQTHTTQRELKIPSSEKSQRSRSQLWSDQLLEGFAKATNDTCCRNLSPFFIHHYYFVRSVYLI